MDKIKKQFLDIFDLSPEIVLDLPLIMLVGQQKLYIENHKGIKNFDSDKIKISINKGYLIFSGKELVVEEIREDCLFISGNIVMIQYEKRGGAV
ncbi:YabP/YqfC family sporulation protein [Halocella sp. SP3-1]|uniref:YabP/YqfC family sporulation protein n=1 Tax=Halocella sp. SP3-1 TaxID=2382161 RepID=UPI000F751565|nr:YabP/YqfC family sporulation protein [Halocella sp. SP3-1]AZO95011.1 sporulation protein YqfC [Halocella sp. SP3-1]MTI61285.1 sporulation protein YqfC [Bacillota bacterium]